MKALLTFKVEVSELGQLCSWIDFQATQALAPIQAEVAQGLRTAKQHLQHWGMASLTRLHCGSLKALHAIQA